MLKKPEEYLQYANKAAYAQLSIEDTEYAEKIEKITVRITQLLGKEQLRKLGSKQMSKLVMIEAIVVRATPVRPMVMQAAFKCKRCGTMHQNEQSGQFLKAPTVCTSPDCGKDGPFEFMPRRIYLHRLPRSTATRTPRRSSSRTITPHISREAHRKRSRRRRPPGDHVHRRHSPRLRPSRPGIGKLRTFILQLDANSIEVMGKEPETSVHLTKKKKKSRP